ncbi:MAG: hypothetical protein WD738_02225 [Pirellulales bacterium]
MVQIAPPQGWQSVATAPSVVQTAFVDLQPAVDAAPPAMEFIDVAAPIAPVAASNFPILLWAIGGAALLVVGGLAGVMWFGGKDAKEDSAPNVAAAAIDEPDERPVVRDPYEVERTARANDAPAAESIEKHSEPVAKNQAEQPPAQPPLPELPMPDVVSDGPAPATESTPALPPAGGGEQIEAAASPENERRAAHVLKFDPLDFDPARLSLASGANSANPPAAGSIADDPASEVDAPAASGGVEADDVLLPPPVRDQTLHARLGPMPSEATRPHKAAEQLGLRVDSFQVSDMPLVRFVGIVSDMAEVPITLDPIALELAGASPLTAVSVRAEDVALETLLQDALAKHRLDVVEHEGQLRVVLRDGERWRAVDYEVKDLGGTDARGISELVQRFVAPATWQAAGGKGTIAVDGTKLKVEQLQRIHHEVLVFCERLRLARGLSARSRYPVQRLSIESPYPRIAARLNQRTMFTFLPWTRLSDVASHWQEMSGLTILVDWAALADAELGPASPVACSAIDRTWQEAFDGILGPLGLAWWAVDGETIQITTRDAVDKIQRIEFYIVPERLRDQFASSEALVESLQNELSEGTAGSRAKSHQPRIALDEPSGRLIVRGTPEAQRHLTQRLGGHSK